MNMQHTTDLSQSVMDLMKDIQHWKPKIFRALRDLRGMYSYNDLVAMVLRQELAFYQFSNCCVFMRVEAYPGYKAYHCFLAAGSLEGLLTEAEPAMMDVAKSLGCEILSMSGRLGFERALKDHGWEPKLVVMHKEVS